MLRIVLLSSRYVGSTLYHINNFNHFTMPYIIAVLALVILGTGYTLFQKTPSTITEQTDTSSVTVVEGSQAEPQVAT